jgi:anti-anti-sigma factor
LAIAVPTHVLWQEETVSNEPAVQTGYHRTVPFDVSVAVEESSATAILTGELDVASSPVLWSRLEPLMRENLHVDVDVRQLAFIDSYGVQILCRLVRRSDPRSMVRVVNPTPAARRLFQLLGVTELLRVAPEPSPTT